ncbi:MAG TPA: hypothetical protein VII38_21965 [Polyangia bacterium]
MAEISEEVRKIIDRLVDSIETLQILLLLQAQPERQWSSTAVASELRIALAAADARLAKLCALNLLDVRIENDLFYWFHPRLPYLEHGVKALARAYAEEPLAVVKLILERPSEPIRKFAEAFQLTKKDKPDG